MAGTGLYFGKNAIGSIMVNVESTGGNTDIEDALVSGTITEYTNDRVTSIRQNAFTYTKLTSVNFPVCTTIGSSAFYYCPSLTTVSFPACKTIGSSAFQYCSSLTTVNFPVCTSIGNNAFDTCTSLTSVNFPACTSIGSYVFGYCPSLTSVNFPVCTNIGYEAFYSCRSLTSVSFPACTEIGNNAFYNCSSLTTVSFPVCTTINNYAFYNCSSLTTVSFPVCTYIGGSAFRNCTQLISLYLTGSSICTLSNSNAFYSTPIGGYSTVAGQYGYIYVPASLLTTYQTATNWTYFADRIVGIEGTTILIAFTIDGTEYQAEKGMTWTEWVESEYNTDGYYVENAIDSKVFTDSDKVVYILSVLSGDEITSNTDYLLIASGNSGGSD